CSRADVPPVRIGSSHRTTRVVVDSAIEESERRVGIPFRPLRGSRLEAQHSALAVVIRQVWIPPQAQVQREAVIHLPVVLNEEAPPRAQQEFEFAATLAVLGRTAEHEIRQSIAGELAVESEIAGHLEGIDDVVSHANSLTAEAQFVGALDLGNDFADGEIAAVEIAQVIRTDTEAACYRESQLRR